MYKIIASANDSIESKANCGQEITWKDYQQGALDIEVIASYLVETVTHKLEAEFPLRNSPESILELYVLITIPEKATSFEIIQELFQTLFQIYRQELIDQIREYYASVYQNPTSLVSDLQIRCNETGLALFKDAFTETYFKPYKDSVARLID